MSYDTSVYNNPQKHGLETVGEAQWGEASYDFNITVVWRDPITNQLYHASDSGCSCPSPFEDYNSRDDLTAATKHEVLALLTRKADEEYSGSMSDCADLIGKVANLSGTVIEAPEATAPQVAGTQFDLHIAPTYNDATTEEIAADRAAYIRAALAGRAEVGAEVSGA